MVEKRENNIKTIISKEIEAFVERHMKREEISSVWGKPIVGFADATDSYIQKLKEIVGPLHEMPKDVLPDAKTVIAYFVPFTRELAKSNSKAGRHASPDWARTYEETNAMFLELNAYLISFLQNLGCKAAISKESLTYDRNQLISNWSQRHFAYAAGLGTFGLNNMLITKAGCCGRYSTVITNVEVTHDEPLKEELCLYKKNGRCKVCVRNCPVGALSTDGYDRKKCYSLCSENAEIYPVNISSYAHDDDKGAAVRKGSEVCGKCITASPCAFLGHIKK